MTADGSTARLVSVAIEDTPLDVYNLTVADFHTFYVRGPVETANDNAPAVWVHNCGPKSVAGMASELRGTIGKNSVKTTTPTSKVRIDLEGDPHFDKVTQKYIPTPHVQTQKIHVGPNNKINLGPEHTRAATKSDIRTAREIIRRR